MEHVAFKNRLIKRFKHLKKWARTHGISCYRVYTHELTDVPAIIDWLDGDVVCWVFDATPMDGFLYTLSDVFECDQKNIYIKQRKKQKGIDSQHEKVASKSIRKVISENGLLFELNLSDYFDTGLFLDHRNARALIREKSSGKSVLNLFAYTGSFSCYAIDGGASVTTTVDLNPNYCDWAHRNFLLNGYSASSTHHIIPSDCFTFLKESKETYDLIICDPPTFSNSKRRDVPTFRINDDYPMLIEACLSRLSSCGQLFFSTNSRSFRLRHPDSFSAASFSALTHKTVPYDFRGHPSHFSWLFSK
jgi:23S rRNA G2069 N7-methylase RlmK/C1962 C5-methylase RlmI